jgi:hypothetical protein
MVTGSRRSARWIIAVLAGALLASAVVVYALVRITTPADGDGSDATPVTTSSTHEPTAASPTDTADTVLQSVMTSPPPTATATVLSPAGTFTATESVPSTTMSALPQSDVILPAAWSGVAKVTVTVLGECASANSSVYADLPADLAFDLVQNEANAAQLPVPAGAHPDDVTMTLGVNPSGVPSLALYSSQIGETGIWQQFWQLTLSADGARTRVRGTLTAQATDGSTPNMMVDAETSLQPCESVGTVSLPRALANGASLDGWVSTTSASLTVNGTTTDGKRKVSVDITAERHG